MMEPLRDLPAGVLGVRASGKLSKDDYHKLLEPLLEGIRERGEQVRFLFQFAPDFAGFTPAALWEDTKVGLRYSRCFERFAVVSDAGWIRVAAKAVGVVLPAPVRAFANAEFAEAVAWLGAPVEKGLTHRLLADRGVLVLEPIGSLSPADFDAVAAVVDPWIEAHGSLQGLVVHARRFPGWDSVHGFWEHLKFVRAHHRKIKRVAIAVDGKVAELAPKLAGHFVDAEIRHFPFEDVDGAVTWAAGTVR